MTDNHGFAPTEKMLDPNGLAQMLRISERRLTDLRHEDHTFPAPRMLGTLPRWSPSAIRRWMEEPPAAPAATPAAAASPVSALARTSPDKGNTKGNGRAVQRVR